VTRSVRPGAGKSVTTVTTRNGRAADQGRPPVAPPATVTVRVLVMLAAFVVMVGFAVVLARLTLSPSAASVDLAHTNMRPGASIRDYLDQPEFRDTVKQLGGNIALGVPFGVLLPVVWPRARGLLRAAVVTAAVMILVEVAQGLLVEGRAFDIDDVILNTAGSILGYLLLGRRLGRAIHPRRHHWWHRWMGGPVREEARRAAKQQVRRATRQAVRDAAKQQAARESAERRAARDTEKQQREPRTAAWRSKVPPVAWRNGIPVIRRDKAPAASPSRKGSALGKAIPARKAKGPVIPPKPKARPGR
jgi:glycopeptide antibiotics resistance protein